MKNSELKNELKNDAARQLKSYLVSGNASMFRMAWDRLNECGIDVDLRAEANEANARALLWIATK
jgi:hypothetical protein